MENPQAFKPLKKIIFGLHYFSAFYQIIKQIPYYWITMTEKYKDSKLKTNN